MEIYKNDIIKRLNENLVDKFEEMRVDVARSIFESTDEVEDDEDLEDCPECEADIFIDEETGEEYYIELDEETLLEYRRKVRVDSKGKRTRRIKCPSGKVAKKVNGRTVCVTRSGADKTKKKLAIRKANRTKKSKGAGYAKRSTRKRLKAVRRRRAMGLKDGT